MAENQVGHDVRSGVEIGEHVVVARQQQAGGHRLTDMTRHMRAS
jgi:hypothetical protein